MPRFLETIPHPWKHADIQQAIFKNSTEAREAIECTKGGQMWRSIKELEDSVYVFHTNISDLLDEITLFADRSKNPDFWRNGYENETDRYTREVKRKLSNCTASLMALVDHARNFNRIAPVPDFDNELKKHFQPPGLHDFLQCFRNYNTHWRIAQANWFISYDLNLNSRQARFQVSKADLLAWRGWNAAAKEYISRIPEVVDLYEVFSTYRANTQNFYAWHRGVVLRQYSDTLRPYLDYKRIFEGINKKYHWNMVISHVPKELNPLQYLENYLPSHKVELVLALPHQSKQQVDEVIRMLDMDEFCDEELRRKVYLLFGAEKIT